MRDFSNPFQGEDIGNMFTLSEELLKDMCRQSGRTVNEVHGSTVEEGAGRSLYEPAKRLLFRHARANETSDHENDGVFPNLESMESLRVERQR
jgi:hypothetical protein